MLKLQLLPSASQRQSVTTRRNKVVDHIVATKRYMTKGRKEAGEVALMEGKATPWTDEDSLTTWQQNGASIGQEAGQVWCWLCWYDAGHAQIIYRS